jgi:hypothetical protein
MTFSSSTPSIEIAGVATVSPSEDGRAVGFSPIKSPRLPEENGQRDQNGGNENGNALDLKVERKFTKGLTFQAGYSYMRDLSDVPGSSEVILVGSCQSL